MLEAWALTLDERSVQFSSDCPIEFPISESVAECAI